MNIGISTVFLLIQKQNDNPNMFCKFQLYIVGRYFLKVETEKGYITPSPSGFDGLPHPG